MKIPLVHASQAWFTVWLWEYERAEKKESIGTGRDNTIMRERRLGRWGRGGVKESCRVELWDSGR